jgi:hypothetical protein
MKTALENIRKVTRFCLAGFLWLHAFFLISPQPVVISRLAQFVHFTTAEVVLVTLLVLFSFIAGSGFWKGFKNLIYIYLFPFVVAGYLLWGCCRLLWWIAKSFSPEAKTKVIVAEQSPAQLIVTAQAQTSAAPDANRWNSQKVLLVLSRPLRRFTLVWCVLLLLTTHTVLLWLSLAVVLVHLARAAFRILKITLFSAKWFTKIIQAMADGIEANLAKLESITNDSAPTPELKTLWNTIQGYPKVFGFLRDGALISQWAWILCGVFLTVVYLYLAVLFSFAYYGIARINGTAFGWPEALVTSVFIPFYVADLPHILAVRILGGFHCAILVAASIGTLAGYVRRRLKSLHTVATIVSVRLEDEKLREKYEILQKKFAAAANSTQSINQP